MILGCLLLATLAGTHPDSAALTVAIDSARHEVVLRLGPFDAEPMGEMHDMMIGHDMGRMDGGEGMMHDSPLYRFTWPVDGWARGFAVAVTDSAGRPASRRMLHHLLVVNFDRRQLLYPMLERLLGAGAETDAVMLPATIGIPVRAGMALGMYVGWHNDTPEPITGLWLEVRVKWSPTNQNPRPLAVLPLYMDTNLDVGVSNAFDIPPGHSEKAWVFTLPVGGRLLGVGGHLHDFGTEVRLEDADRGRTLVTLKARREADGKVDGVDRRLFGVSGAGLRLVAGRRYRVVGVYDNPGTETVTRGAMAHMVGIYVPDDLTRWPAVDWADATIRKDLEGLGLPAGGP